MTLGERSSAQGLENEQRVLLVLVAAGDQGLAPGDLAGRSGLVERTARAAAERLVGRQLASRTGQRGRLFATMAGRSEAGAGVPGVDLMPELEAAIDCFPSEAQRAFARLLLAGIVARHHLAGIYRDGWGGFVALGGTQTGKTSLAKLPCRVFNWPEVGTIRMLPDETAGSVLSRRVQAAEGWSVQISPVLGQPYVCFDEWDKAEIDTRKAAGQLLMGYVATELEGQSVEIRPTVMVCLNTGPEGLGALHQAYVRRSVVLDTTPLEGLLGDIDEAMRKLFRSMRIPRLQLEQLRPPATELDEADRAALRNGLREGLTAEGWRLCDVEVLSRLALGRAALTGEQDLHRAALATALDYLATAATAGHTRPGYAGPLMAQLGGRGVGGLAPDAVAAEEELDRRSRAQSLKDRQEREQLLVFEADRERRAQLLLAAKSALGRVVDPEARAVGAALARAIKGVRGSRARAALDEAWSLAAPWLEQADRIRQARDQAKAAEQARRRDVQYSRREQRAAAAANRRWSAEQRRTKRAEWVRWRASLARMVPVESAGELMADLWSAQVVERQDISPPAGANFLQRALAQRHAWWWSGREVTIWDASTIWLETWRTANRQVVELGGKAAREPRYREKAIRRAS